MDKRNSTYQDLPISFKSATSRLSESFFEAPAPRAGTLSITLRQIAEVHRGIRASVPDFSDIHAVLCREKRVRKRVIATAPISDGRIRRLWRSTTSRLSGG